MNADQVAAAYADLTQITGPALYVQAIAPRDHAEVSTIFAITSDPSFGALISFGIGGIATELLNDRAYRRATHRCRRGRTDQCTARSAGALIGYRGDPPVATEPLARPRIEVVRAPTTYRRSRELQLLPVLCGPAGIAVTSATGRIGPRSAQLDARRRLS